jgi:hypothetical protein
MKYNKHLIEIVFAPIMQIKMKSWIAHVVDKSVENDLPIFVAEGRYFLGLAL